jgi:hypothetical protein
MARSIADQCKAHGSQGAKVVRCVRCGGNIQPYAGRRVAAYSDRYAHHWGQCQDQAEREAALRQVAEQTEFAWECRHVESGSTEAELCNVAGMGLDSEATYRKHIADHGKRELKPTVAPIKLRRKPPAAKGQVPNVPPFKRIVWTQDGQEHRGQFWANGAGQYEVIAIEDRRHLGLSNRLVTLYLDGQGNLSPDYSAAKSDRKRSHEIDSAAVTTAIRYHLDRKAARTA